MSRILHFCSFPHPVSSLKRCALCGSTAIVNSLAFHPDAHPKRIERGTSRLHVKCCHTRSPYPLRCKGIDNSGMLKNSKTTPIMIRKPIGLPLLKPTIKRTNPSNINNPISKVGYSLAIAACRSERSSCICCSFCWIS